MTDADPPRPAEELLARLTSIEPPAALDRMVLASARAVLEEHAARHQRVLDESAARQRTLEEEAERRAKQKLITAASS